MDLLIRLRKMVTPVAAATGLRPAGRWVYRRLFRWRYGTGRLAAVRRSGRTWRLLPQFALDDEVYEPETVDWLRRTLSPGDVFLDVGGHVGLIAMEGAELVGPSGRVLAVEPIEANRQAIATHASANRLSDRIVVVPAACAAAHGGRVALRVDARHEYWTGATIVRHRHLTGDEAEVAVPAVSVDGLVGDHRVRPRAIKIDVEGAELEVVRGAARTLAECRPVVWVAFHPHAFADPAAATAELRGLFHRAGYRTPDPDAGEAYGLNEYEMRPPG